MILNKTHYHTLEQLYLSAPIQKLYPDTVIGISEKQSNIKMPIKADHLHAANALHGSVYFRLLDDAAFFAANSIELDYFILTASFKVKFLKPVTLGILECNGIVTDFNDSKIFSKSELYNDNNELIATGDGIFIRSKMLLKTLANKCYE